MVADGHDVRARQVHNGMIATLARIQRLRRVVVRNPRPEPLWLDHELQKVEELVRSLNVAHSALWDAMHEDAADDPGRQAD